MNIEFTGATGWIVGVVIASTTILIVVIGAWQLINWILWEVFFKQVMTWLKLYHRFVEWMFYRKEFYKWQKEHRPDTFYSPKSEQPNDQH